MTVLQAFGLGFDFLLRTGILLLVQSRQAEIIIVKSTNQGRNNVTRVRVEPRSFKQGNQKKNGAFTVSATLPTNTVFNLSLLQNHIRVVDFMHSQHYLSAIENQTQKAVQRILHSWLTNSVVARVDDRKVHAQFQFTLTAVSTAVIVFFIYLFGCIIIFDKLWQIEQNKTIILTDLQFTYMLTRNTLV